MSLINNQFFKTFLESISEGILVVNKEFEIIFINDAIQGLFGYKEEELIGERIEILIPSNFKNNHKNHTKAYFAHPDKRKMSERDEIYGLHKNGDLLSIDIGLNHFKNEGEQYAIAIISDISQSKMTNKFLKSLYQTISNVNLSTQEKIKHILILGCTKFQLEVGFLSKIEGEKHELIELNSDEKIRAILIDEIPEKTSDTFCQFVINSEDPIYISNISNSEFSKHPAYLTRKMETFIGAKVMVNNELYGAITFSSEEVRNHVTATDLEILKLMAQWIGYLMMQEELIGKMHLFNSELESKIASRTQELKHALSEIQDINISLKEEVEKRKEAEENANASLEKEKQLNTLKSRFVSTASHEFRTPLTGILSSVTLIDKYAAPEFESKRNKHINIIKSSVKNLTNILNDFLSLSKLESGYVECDASDFALAIFIEETIEETKPTLKPGQKITKKIDVSSDFIVHQDAKLLKNIVINLLSNSSKYSAEDKTIEVSVTKNSTDFFISVKDYGIGIPEEDKSNLFDRFFRATNSTAYQGTGLGLNITKKNVELMNGTITFDSIENVETTFVIQLPIKYNHEKESTYN